MNRFVRRFFSRRFLIVSVAALFFVGAVYAGSVLSQKMQEKPLSLDTSSLATEDFDFQKARAEWSQRIDAVGPKKAYEELKERYESAESVGHAYSHVFGRLLYEKFGVEGMAICDNAISFGCFHEFIGDAIADRGLDVVPLLSERCESPDAWASSVCRHGIGHGVLASFGYDAANIARALDVCTATEGPNIGGCSGGVFMEYNFQTMLQEQAKVRELRADNLHQPCSQLDPAYREACYFWQPDWWGRVLPGDLRARYERIGTLCGELQVKVERESCFRGAGNVVGDLAGWNIEEALLLCSRLGAEGMPWCRETGADIFWVTKGSQEALKMCEGLEGEWARRCASHTR